MAEQKSQRVRPKYRDGHGSISTTSLTRSTHKEAAASTDEVTPQQSEIVKEQRPHRQVLMPALGAGVTLMLVIITAIYALETGAASHVRFVYESSSNTIFVLSVLSGVTGILLGVTIDASVERLQWMLVVRQQGVRLVDFMSLHSSTGALGLLRLALGPGIPFLSSTRWWSLGRLIATVLVPILGVLIMSDVNTKMTFFPIDTSEPALGWGMSAFNASLGKEVIRISDQVLQAVSITSDTRRIVDVTSHTQSAVACLGGPNAQPAPRCERTFFAPGGIESVAAKFEKDKSLNKSDAFLAKNQQGYLLAFREGEESWKFEESECITYGFSFAAFLLCMRDKGEHSVEARILPCPSEFSLESNCLKDESWHSYPGWQATLNASFIRADVAYSKTNGTILSHTFTEEIPRPARAPAADMLIALRYAIPEFSGTGLASLLPLLADPGKMKLFTLYAYPAWVWSWLNSASTLSQQDPAMATRGAETLQSLLVVILHFCQPSVYARALHRLYDGSPATGAPSGNSSDDALTQFAADVLAIAPADTTVYPALLRYQIVVGQSTLIAYMVLSVAVVFVCVCVLAVSSFGRKTYRYPKTSGFPVWDTYAFCTVSGSDRAVGNSSQSDIRNLEGKSMINTVANMRVRLNGVRDERYDPPDDGPIALQDWGTVSRDGSYRTY